MLQYLLKNIFLQYKQQYEKIKFAIVGSLIFIIDSLIYALLLKISLNNNPIKAKVIAGLIATIFSWIANKLWTFKVPYNKTSLIKELILFFFTSILSLLIPIICIIISHYVLCIDTKKADFISGNIIGLIFGTIFRYFSFKKIVFNK